MCLEKCLVPKHSFYSVSINFYHQTLPQTKHQEWPLKPLCLQLWQRLMELINMLVSTNNHKLDTSNDKTERTNKQTNEQNKQVNST